MKAGRCLLPRWFLALLGLLAVSAMAVGQAPPAGEKIPGLDHLERQWRERLPGRAEETFTKILENVETGQDGWVTEHYYEQLVELLKHSVGPAMSQRPVDAPTLQALLHPDYRGTSLLPQRRDILREDAYLTIVWFEPATEDSVDAGHFLADLERFLAPYQRLETAEFKIFGIAVDSNDGRLVQTQVRYSLNGPALTGEALQTTGHWRVTWQRQPDESWRLLRLRAEAGWQNRSAKKAFTDITACSVGRDPAYTQLLRGVETWAATLDAAYGIDIYGHNGLAVGDVDGDGLEDFYVCQPGGLPNRLFRNNGDGTFSDIAVQAGVDVLDHTSAALLADYDNDGDQDLFLVGFDVLLFKNTGAGKFTYQDPAGVGLVAANQERATRTSACMADYNRDGFLDLYVTSYLFWREGDFSYSHPIPFHDANNGAPNTLFRNNGDGTFTDVTVQSGVDENNRRFTFACAWGDYDNDGWPDLYAANDFGRNNLYHNQGDGTFREVAPASGVEDPGFGMSAAWGDLDRDGWLDLYVGNMWTSAGLRVSYQPSFRPQAETDLREHYHKMVKGNSLFRNRGDGTFEDATDSSGTGFGRWAWSSNLFDFDNDGWEDVYVLNGHITNESPHDL